MGLIWIVTKSKLYEKFWQRLTCTFKQSYTTRIQPTLSHEQINSFHVFLELFRQIKICYILLAFKYLNLWLQKVWTQDKWGHRAQHTGPETRGDTLPAPATWIFFIQGYICRNPLCSNLEVIEEPALIFVGKSLDEWITNTALNLQLCHRHFSMNPWIW